MWNATEVLDGVAGCVAMAMISPNLAAIGAAERPSLFSRMALVERKRVGAYDGRSRTF
ncbi:MAG: hypothetical protein OEL78_01240 [Hyphomicrobiales bacterium]|nr:hypothetical protein [Hyphomicrobiales bacterium]